MSGDRVGFFITAGFTLIGGLGFSAMGGVKVCPAGRVDAFKRDSSKLNFLRTGAEVWLIKFLCFPAPKVESTGPVAITGAGCCTSRTM